MSEPNGAAAGGSELLDRIERELKLMSAYHIQFREEYKLLLSGLAENATWTGRVAGGHGFIDSSD
jgi:hypothetical protein